ncbi:XRE family transcriptional regulator [Aneurinibacillus sp. XH2]|uniref:helix-turn-helix transcriptional regulator n=1 Tax=Aneurinibacillus sp. XH2 TaxID=1450761 RepID=UPI000709C0FD|nr:helix-turn-helix domain-containing protein [Aneurinibacillus sp. XH2]AMA72897.1 XRE family transcriptional regulator [Aneurinibacillus sp. XH2]
MTYKNKLREIRLEVGMPVSELARRSKTTRQTITNIELHGQEPSVTLALKIAKALKRDPYDIFFTNDVIHDLQKGDKTA